MEPGESTSSDVEGGFEAGEKDAVVDGVEGCSEIEENEHVRRRSLVTFRRAVSVLGCKRKPD